MESYTQGSGKSLLFQGATIRNRIAGRWFMHIEFTARGL
jgi:hypothetical protein